MASENRAADTNPSGAPTFCCESLGRAFGVAIGLAGFGPDDLPFMFVGIGIFPSRGTAEDLAAADESRRHGPRERAIGLVRYCPFCGEPVQLAARDFAPLPNWDVRDLRGKELEDICFAGEPLDGAVCTSDQALYLDGLPGVDLTGLLVDVSGGSYVRILRPRMTTFDSNGHLTVPSGAYEIVALTKPRGT